MKVTISSEGVLTMLLVSGMTTNAMNLLIRHH